MNQGCYDISSNEYHGGDGISRSMLMDLIRSPLHYWHNHINPDKKPRETNDDFAIGSAVHCLLLEPEKFAGEFFVKDKVDGRTTVGKEYAAKIAILAANKTIINAKDKEIIKNMVDATENYQPFIKFMDGASVEQSFFWRDQNTGFMLKSRPDIYNEQLSIICEIKTTASAEPDDFKRSVCKYGYHIQAAMQMDAIENILGKAPRLFFIIAIPKTAPYMPYIYGLDEEIINKGRMEYKTAFKILKKCQESGLWHEEREKTNLLTLADVANFNNNLYRLMERYDVTVS